MGNLRILDLLQVVSSISARICFVLFAFLVAPLAISFDNCGLGLQAVYYKTQSGQIVSERHLSQYDTKGDELTGEIVTPHEVIQGAWEQKTADYLAAKENGSLTPTMRLQYYAEKLVVDLGYLENVQLTRFLGQMISNGMKNWGSEIKEGNVGSAATNIFLRTEKPVERHAFTAGRFLKESPQSQMRTLEREMQEKFHTLDQHFRRNPIKPSEMELMPLRIAIGEQDSHAVAQAWQSLNQKETVLGSHRASLRREMDEIVEMQQHREGLKLKSAGIARIPEMVNRVAQLLPNITSWSINKFRHAANPEIPVKTYDLHYFFLDYWLYEKWIFKSSKKFFGEQKELRLPVRITFDILFYATLLGVYNRVLACYTEDFQHNPIALPFVGQAGIRPEQKGIKSASWPHILWEDGTEKPEDIACNDAYWKKAIQEDPRYEDLRLKMLRDPDYDFLSAKIDAILMQSNPDEAIFNALLEGLSQDNHFPNLDRLRRGEELSPVERVGLANNTEVLQQLDENEIAYLSSSSRTRIDKIQNRLFPGVSPTETRNTQDPRLQIIETSQHTDHLNDIWSTVLNFQDIKNSTHLALEDSLGVATELIDESEKASIARLQNFFEEEFQKVKTKYTSEEDPIKKQRILDEAKLSFSKTLYDKLMSKIDRENHYQSWIYYSIIRNDGFLAKQQIRLSDPVRSLSQLELRDLALLLSNQSQEQQNQFIATAESTLESLRSESETPIPALDKIIRDLESLKILIQKGVLSEIQQQSRNTFQLMQDEEINANSLIAFMLYTEDSKGFRNLIEEALPQNTSN